MTAPDAPLPAAALGAPLAQVLVTGGELVLVAILGGIGVILAALCSRPIRESMRFLEQRRKPRGERGQRLLKMRQLRSGYGLSLRGRDLRGEDLADAFLADLDLSDTDLRGGGPAGRGPARDVSDRCAL